MRCNVFIGSGVVWLLIASCALAASAGRDKEWSALIAAARARGATETQLDRSASYVFQVPDGDFLTFTRLLTTDKGRSICLIKQNQTATACADWDTGKLTLGKRADSATPWTFFTFASLDALDAAKPTLADDLAQGLQRLMKGVSNPGEQIGKNCWGVSHTGYLTHIANENC